MGRHAGGVWAVILAVLAVGPVASAVAAPRPATGERHVALKGRHFEFEYSYPAVAAAFPGLRAWLEADLKKKRAEQHESLAVGAPTAQEPAYSFSQVWQVVTQTPRWLSLSAGIADYSGGAHLNYAFETVLWDKQLKQVWQPLDLFVSREALVKVISEPFCAELDRQRAEKRGEPVNRASGNDFDECIDPTDQVVILGSRSKVAFDRIGMLIGPYRAGPWTEGEYEVTLPVTPQVLAVVRPEFRPGFAVMR